MEVEQQTNDGAAEPPDQQQKLKFLQQPVEEVDTEMMPDKGRNPYYCLHKNIVMRKNELGRGLYASAPIKAGELIYTAEGSTTLISVHTKTIATWPQEQADLFETYSWQVGEEEWAGPGCEDDVRNDYVNFLNHSCDPTAWFTGYEVLHARRDIQVGEQITFDYATSDVTAAACLLNGCLCKAAKCRKRVSPWDYRLPSLQGLYQSHFMPYINARVAAEPPLNLGTGPYSQLHANVELRESPIAGKGLFATTFIKKGTIVWCEENDDSELRADFATVQAFSEEQKRWFLKFCWQVDDDVFSGPRSAQDIDADHSNFINHSCDPTLWFIGDKMLEARRDIQPGEELTYDYATVDSVIERIPECHCGASCCRGSVKRTDYLLSELQSRYKLHFALYLLAKFYDQWETQLEIANEGC